MNLATESLTDAVGYHLVPMCQVIGLSDRGGPADTAPDGYPEDDAGHRDLGDRNRESRKLQMVAYGSLLGHPISGGSGTCAMGDGQGAPPNCQVSAEVTCPKIEDAEAKRLNPEDVGGPSAPGMRLYNLDRLVNWSNEFLGRRDTDQIYLIPIIRGDQVAIGDSAADQDKEDENSRSRSNPPALRLLTRPSPDQGSVRIISIQYFIERGSHSSLEKGEIETKRESVVGSNGNASETKANKSFDNGVFFRY